MNRRRCENCNKTAKAVYKIIEVDDLGEPTRCFLNGEEVEFHTVEACTRGCAREASFGTVRNKLPKGASVTLLRKL